MQFILNIPMLANHRDEGCGRAADAGNIDTIITGDWCTSIGRTNSFHDNHRLQIQPFRELRDGCEVCYGPDSSSYGAAMGIIEGIKEILGGAPGELMFDMLMEVPFDRRIGFFVTLIGSRALMAYDDVDGPSAANNRLWSRRGTARLLRRSDASASAHGCAGTHSVRRAGVGSVG